MSRRRRVWIWVGRMTSAAVVVGLVLYLVAVGLDTAAKLANVIGMLVAVAALLVSYLLPTSSREVLPTAPGDEQTASDQEPASMGDLGAERRASNNPWRISSLRERLRTAETELGEQVLGQPHAITQVLRIAAQSAVGLAAATRSGARPRGILTLAGPVGVGKTVLVTALADLLFGTEDALLSIDMGEYAADHSVWRLIGPRPGIDEFNGEGVLANKMRPCPPPVVLFDEIEKAHPRVLDKIIQVLDDGRLVNGSGNTIDFTETLIVLTTDVGMVTVDPVMNVDIALMTPEATRPEIEAHVREAIKEHFSIRVGRPGLYHRISDTIVVFDFLRPPFPEQIADHAINRVAATTLEQHGVYLELTSDVRSQLVALATSSSNLGGHGIVSAIEAHLVSPLAWNLFVGPRPRGSTLRVLRVESTNAGSLLVVE